VGWEKRERGAGPYYYRSVREGNRVRKEYIGSGQLAEALAQADETIRQRREQEAARWREEREHTEDLVAPLLELCEATKVLVRAHLIAEGWHEHKGEWRRAREHSA
jgi:hypothetical protein